MAYIARNEHGELCLFNLGPVASVCRYGSTPDCDHYLTWLPEGISVNDYYPIILQDDADEYLIGRHLTWEDEPVEI